MKEKKQRIEDAVAATKAAVEEGIVPGGGVAFIRASSALDKIAGQDMTPDEFMGIDILKRALEEPVRQIAVNAGKDGSVVVAEVKKNDGAFGYNARDDRYEDMITAGIVDPTKVTRSALQNAASIAALLLTTECIVTDLPEKKGDASASGGMGGGMGGMGGGMGF